MRFSFVIHRLFSSASRLALAAGMVGLLSGLTAFAPSAWAQTCQYFDDFKDNGDGTVWQRCAVGQRWNGSGCSGEGESRPWWDAMRAAKANRFLGKADWRLPTKDEGAAIVAKYDDCKNTKPLRAVSSVFQAIDSKGDELGYYWTSSPYVGDSYLAWLVYFLDGLVNYDYRSDAVHVRLVRASQSSYFRQLTRPNPATS